MNNNDGLVKGSNSDSNRKLLESKSTKVLILDHSHDKRDSLYERDSGLNHVLCKIAYQKGIVFVIDLNELVVSDLKSRAQILGRIIQNIRLINKFHNKLRIIPIKSSNKYNTTAFLSVLGLPSKMLADSLSY